MITNIHYDRDTMEPIITKTSKECFAALGCPKNTNVVPINKNKMMSIAPAIKGDGRVAIIILAWNQLSYTKICIESIKKLTKRDRYDLIIVDQCSNDGTIEYLKNVLDGDGDIIIRNSFNRGFSGGNNQGLRVAECEYVLMLNNDCRIERGNWLDMLLSAREDDIGIVGALCQKGSPDHAKKVFDHVGVGRESDQWSYIEGWCLFGKRELFVELNGFDMRFNPAYGEDADMSYRVKTMGLKIKELKNLPIKHFGSRSKGQLDAWMPTQSDNSSKQLFKKWISKDVEEIEPIKEAEQEKSKEEEPETKKLSILFRRRGARGDVLLTTPILKELKKKYPGSLLVYETDCPDMLTGNPYVDHTEKRVPKPEQYDIVLTPRYEKDMSKNAINTMAKQCGVELSEKKIEIYLTDDQRMWAQNKVDASKMNIAFHTGRAWKSKEWLIERFREVALHYAKKGYGILELGDRATQYTGAGNDCRGCSIKQTAAIIAQCSIFVGIDSGCAHLAKAVGTPAVVIYGSVDPSTASSDAVEYPVRVEDLECKGCRGRTSAEWVDCHKEEVYCLTRITPQMVIETVDMCISNEIK